MNIRDYLFVWPVCRYLINMDEYIEFQTSKATQIQTAAEPRKNMFSLDVMIEAIRKWRDDPAPF